MFYNMYIIYIVLLYMFMAYTLFLNGKLFHPQIWPMPPTMYTFITLIYVFFISNFNIAISSALYVPAKTRRNLSLHLIIVQSSDSTFM